MKLCPHLQANDNIFDYFFRLWNCSEEWMELKRSFYLSIKLRGYDNICLLNANDSDVMDFIQNYPHGAKHIHTLR